MLERFCRSWVEFSYGFAIVVIAVSVIIAAVVSVTTGVIWAVSYFGWHVVSISVLLLFVVITMLSSVYLALN